MNFSIWCILYAYLTIISVGPSTSDHQCYMATPFQGYISNPRVFKATGLNSYDHFPSEAIANDVIYIHLLNQNISTISDVHLNAFPNLKKLLFCKNKLQYISNGAFSGTNLTHLTLARNKINGFNLPMLHDACQAMTYLDLSYNLIRFIPPEFLQNCASLQEFYVTRNQLCAIPDVSPAQLTLRRLNLDHNSIPSPPRDWLLCLLQTLKHLEYFGLEYNNIEIFPDITGIPTQSNLLVSLAQNPIICDCRHAWIIGRWNYYYYYLEDWSSDYEVDPNTGQYVYYDYKYTYYDTPTSDAILGDIQCSSSGNTYYLHQASENDLCPGGLPTQQPLPTCDPTPANNENCSVSEPTSESPISSTTISNQATTAKGIKSISFQPVTSSLPDVTLTGKEHTANGLVTSKGVPGTKLGTTTKTQKESTTSYSSSVTESLTDPDLNTPSEDMGYATEEDITQKIKIIGGKEIRYGFCIIGKSFNIIMRKKPIDTQELASINDLKAEDRVDCFLKCEEQWCCSFYFNTKNGSCVLHEKFLPEHIYLKSDIWQFYQIKMEKK